MALVPRRTRKDTTDSGGHVVQALENANQLTRRMSGMTTAQPFGRRFAMALSRMLSVVLVVLLPGGLVMLAAWLYASAVATQMQQEQGLRHRRLARAMVHVQWRDVWSRARHHLG